MTQDQTGKAGDMIPIFNARTGKTENVAPVIKTDEEWRAQTHGTVQCGQETGH